MLDFIKTATASTSASTDLTALRAELAELELLSNDSIAEQKERESIIKQMNRLKNPEFIRNKAMQALKGETTARLLSIEKFCKDHVSLNKVRTADGTADRVFKTTRHYAFGNQIAILSGIISGLQYSTEVHKQYLCQQLNISYDLVESLASAFGQETYSTKTGDIIPEQPANVYQLQSLLPLVEDVWSINLDKSELTQEHYIHRATLTANKAERDSLKYRDAKRIARMEEEASAQVELPDLDIL